MIGLADIAECFRREVRGDGSLALLVALKPTRRLAWIVWPAGTWGE